MNNGYTKYFNDIFDLALRELDPHEFKVFSFIYRKIIGWNGKTSECIPYSQFMDATGCSRNGTRGILRRLEAKGWIEIDTVYTPGGMELKRYSFGKVGHGVTPSLKTELVRRYTIDSLPEP